MVSRLPVWDAARVATLSSECLEFFRSRLSLEQAHLLGVLVRGVPGRITGQQMRFLRRLLKDAVRGRLLSSHWEGAVPADPTEQRFCIDAFGERKNGGWGAQLPRCWDRGCLVVTLGWIEEERHMVQGQHLYRVHALPYCWVTTPAGPSIDISKGRQRLNKYDKVPMSLADLSVFFRQQGCHDAQWLRALLLGISLFALEKQFEESVNKWKGSRRRPNRREVLYETAPRVVALSFDTGNGQGAEELRVLKGMRGLAEGAGAFACYHVGHNLLPRQLSTTYQGWTDAKSAMYDAAKRGRGPIEEHVARPGTGAVLLVRVVNNWRAGVEEDGVIAEGANLSAGAPR